MSDNLPEEQLIDDEKPLEQSGGELAPLAINLATFDHLREGYGVTIDSITGNIKITDPVKNNESGKNVFLPERNFRQELALGLAGLTVLYMVLTFGANDGFQGVLNNVGYRISGAEVMVPAYEEGQFGNAEHLAAIIESLNTVMPYKIDTYTASATGGTPIHLSWVVAENMSGNYTLTEENYELDMQRLLNSFAANTGNQAYMNESLLADARSLFAAAFNNFLLIVLGIGGIYSNESIERNRRANRNDYVPGRILHQVGEEEKKRRSRELQKQNRALEAKANTSNYVPQNNLTGMNSGDTQITREMIERASDPKCDERWFRAKFKREKSEVIAILEADSASLSNEA